MSEAIWEPDRHRLETSNIAAFCSIVNAAHDIELVNGSDLRSWSQANSEDFWSTLWDHFGVLGDKGDAPYLTSGTMLDSRFFPQAQLNLAENMLRMGPPRDPEGTAIVFRGEDKAEERWSYEKLDAHVSRLQQALVGMGVKKGDRVAAMLPNRPEAIAAMLATLSIGAIWCSASPDFGARAILDRFSQIQPKVFFTVDGYWYAGKKIDTAQKVMSIAPRLESSVRTVVVNYLGGADELADHLHNGVSYTDLQAAENIKDVTFERLPFDHPAYILFSSGTTGAPKCIVHRAGGVLLQHVKEHALHTNVKPGDRLFYFTTLGWMMWNWLVSGLASQATLMLFDGSPFHPGPEVLFEYAEAERFTHFGTSAKYLDSLRKAKFDAKSNYDLSSMTAVLSTGSPLLNSGFDYVYGSIKDDVHLASIAGGTDIVSCFVCGDPTAPVFRGEIQGAGFGMPVDVLDGAGQPAAAGTRGELVCTGPFPSMPLGFWGDTSGERYKSTYFNNFDGIWCQGDFSEKTEQGGFVIHGRSDTTLNPGGVRIGTAEIYAEVEKFDEVTGSVVIGQEHDGDQRVVLFVVLKDAELDDDLRKKMRTAIRSGSSPRHVPAIILAVPDIPRTKNGKVSEISVKQCVNGRSIANADALDNPEALDLFRNLPELA